MPSPTRLQSLLDTRSLSTTDILSLFQSADEFARAIPRTAPANKKIVCCLFFEASTRTRLSFQTAAYRLGHDVLTMETSSSSLVKGETYTDTLLNIAAMNPDILVVRYGHSPEVDALLANGQQNGLTMPVINAGSGVDQHPTQALLDAYTIHKELGQIKGAKVLIVGDVVHSRVARSNLDVLTRLGAEIAVCGPANYLPEQGEFPGVKQFSNLDDALGWPTVFMGLRVQKERHGIDKFIAGSAEEYHRDFGLTADRLKKIEEHAIIMHPGPINYGIEFSPEVLQDKRNRILKQVSNGVLIRAVLLESML